jgi:hypothetical protein
MIQESLWSTLAAILLGDEVLAKYLLELFGLSRQHYLAETVGVRASQSFEAVLNEMCDLLCISAFVVSPAANPPQLLEEATPCTLPLGLREGLPRASSAMCQDAPP